MSREAQWLYGRMQYHRHRFKSQSIFIGPGMALLQGLRAIDPKRTLGYADISSMEYCRLVISILWEAWGCLLVPEAAPW